MRIGVGLAALALGASVLGASAQSVDYTGAIYDAAARYGVSGDWMYNTVMCESGGDPGAYNEATGDQGIAQFHAATFWAYANPGQDINNPYDQLDVMARMFSEGLSYEWLCA